MSQITGHGKMSLGMSGDGSGDTGTDRYAVRGIATRGQTGTVGTAECIHPWVKYLYSVGKVYCRIVGLS